MEEASANDDPMGARFRYNCYYENNPESCHQLGTYLTTYMNQAAKARKVFQMNCEKNGFSESCFKLANMFFLGRGGEKNLEEACKYYENGCNDKHAQSCYNLGMIYTGEESKKNFRKAARYYEIGCENGYSRSCQRLSSLYITGSKDLQKNMKKAFRYARKGCMLGDPYACVNLSIMYDRGEGVNKNEDMAKQLKACVQDLEKDMKSITPDKKEERLQLFKENVAKLIPPQLN